MPYLATISIKILTQSWLLQPAMATPSIGIAHRHPIGTKHFAASLSVHRPPSQSNGLRCMACQIMQLVKLPTDVFMIDFIACWIPFIGLYPVVIRQCPLQSTLFYCNFGRKINGPKLFHSDSNPSQILAMSLV